LLNAAAELAVEAPSVGLLTRSVVTAGTSHTFHLVVKSSAGVSPTAVGNDDVLVSGPRGFSGAAGVVSVATSTDGTRQIVTCRVAAPGGFFDRSDNGVYRVAVRDGAITDDAGAAAPGGVVGGFRVFARRPAAPTPVPPIPSRATSGPLSAAVTSLYAWCDHMPGRVGPEPDNREFVRLAVGLTNNSDRPLEVRLDRAFASFDENDLGQPNDAVSIEVPGGGASGVKTVLLQPGQHVSLWFRGEGAFPEGHHGQRLYLTLQFSAGDTTVAVRTSAVVVATS
jgi:uncharacterized protein (DUF3820 family)